MTIFGNFDIAQLVLYAFWAFFFCLVVYLQREALREGYPLESEMLGKPEMTGLFGDLPKPKTWTLPHGRGTVSVPNPEKDAAEITDRKLAMKPTARWSGSPFEPTGDPMVDGVGPAAWAQRRDVPDLTISGHVKIVPMREHGDWSIWTEGRDIRGWTVVGCDGKPAGTAMDVWIDQSETVIRYVEVALTEGGTRLVPMPCIVVSIVGHQLKVDSIRADQFAKIPVTKKPNEITFLEEDKIGGYIAGGKLYATRDRLEPWL